MANRSKFVVALLAGVLVVCSGAVAAAAGSDPEFPEAGVAFEGSTKDVHASVFVVDAARRRILLSFSADCEKVFVPTTQALAEVARDGTFDGEVELLNTYREVHPGPALGKSVRTGDTEYDSGTISFEGKLTDDGDIEGTLDLDVAHRIYIPAEDDESGDPTQAECQHDDVAWKASPQPPDAGLARLDGVVVDGIAGSSTPTPVTVASGDAAYVLVSGGGDRPKDGTRLARATKGEPSFDWNVKIKAPTDSIAVDDQAVWLLDGDRGRLRKVDPSTGKVQDTISVDTQGNAFRPSIASLNGVLWLTGEDSVLKVDPSTGTTTQEVPIADPSGIVSGADGVYVKSHDEATNATLLARIDPASGAITQTVPFGDFSQFVVTGDGQLWSVEDFGDVARLDPVTLATLVSGPGLTDDDELRLSGQGMTVAAPGGWFPSLAGVVAVDASTFQPVVTVPLPQYGLTLASSGGTVWAYDVGLGAFFEIRAG